MHGLACVFFHVRTGYVDGFHIVADYDFQFAVFDNRQIQLADLIAFGQVGIEVVFAVEHVFPVDFRIQSQTQFDGFFNDFTVHYRQYARQRAFHYAGVRVGFCAECGRCAAEDFGFGVQLDVDFQADYGFPGHKRFFL